ncbi:integral membrane sensor signal transduction histidine kinase [Alkaliphilus metalliredigens QYMF]|uniref:histidine kinase n=1 Tax=Alkaliphilus metalliredigens (strain QYMF) TaxID=293826 RepID=A6TW29_ALKMQ|nr:PAS domain-containing sensor histidine kinase [Alkaliphilus metalliredigens]ABR50397.1 integral membrane sensor signal transduction histidine kinase [Alkaliphilus metalliredigens QYMF]
MIKNGLQRRLGVAIIIIIIFTSIVSLYFDYSDTRSRMIEENLKETQNIGYYVELYFEKLRCYVQMLAEQPAMTSLDIPVLTGILDNEVDKEHRLFNTLIIVDEEGRSIISSNQQDYGQPVELMGAKELQGLLSSETDMTSSFYINEMNKSTFAISAPIVRQYESEKRLLIAYVDLEQFRADMQNYILEENKYFIVVDENQRSVYHPHTIISHEEERKFVENSFPMLYSGERGYLEERSFLDNEKKVFTYVPIYHNRRAVLLVQPSVNLSRVAANMALRKGIILIIIYIVLFQLYYLYKEIQRKESVIQAINTEKYAALGQIATGIAHEIKNPLTVVKGYLQLQRYKIGKPIDEDLIDLMCEEMDRASSIVEEFLVLGRRGDPQMTPCEMTNLVEEVLSVLKHEADKKGISVNRSYQNTSKIQADIQRIKQVLMNIIKNGIEAMEQNGKLMVEVFLKGEEVVTVIQDTGEGIPHKFSKYIGTPYMTTKENGTGLGLSVSYEIIRVHGGRIDFQSEEGVGTTFTIYLPIISQ